MVKWWMTLIGLSITMEDFAHNLGQTCIITFSICLY